MRANTNPTLLLMLLLLLGLSLNTGCLIISTGGHHDDCDEYGDCHDDWGDDNNYGGGGDWGDDNNYGGDDNNYGGGDDDCAEPGEVCGEDGVTYESACAASRAHVYVDYQGACGVVCAADVECELGEICGDVSGRCEVTSCTTEVQQVCGADGLTYDNACQARSQHVEVIAQGECAPSCVADADCDAGSICESGFCAEANCPVLDPEDYSQEVCGADGFTYKTECEARVSRISVVHQGCCI